MVAVITSTSIIRHPEDLPESYLSDSEKRITQTQQTIKSLKDVGIEHIYLFDNSGSLHKEYLASRYKDVYLFVQDQYSFKNKGLSEIHLLLNNFLHLPSDTPICKISGRYVISDKEGFWNNVRQLGQNDFLALMGIKGITTRMYLVKSKLVWENILISILNKCYHRQYAITGVRSLRNYFFRKLGGIEKNETPFLAIESALYEIVKPMGIKIKYVDKIHIRGSLGLDSNVLIEE